MKPAMARTTRAQSKAMSSQEESSENLYEAKSTKVVRKTRKTNSTDNIPSATSKKSHEKSEKQVAKEKTETPKTKTRKGTTSKKAQSKSPEPLEDVKLVVVVVARKPRQRKSLENSQPKAARDSQEKSLERVEDQGSSGKRTTRACRTRSETGSECKENSRSISASNDEKTLESSGLVKEDTSLELEKTEASKQKATRKKKADKIPESIPEKRGKESSEQEKDKKGSVNEKQTKKQNSIDKTRKTRIATKSEYKENSLSMPAMASNDEMTLESSVLVKEDTSLELDKTETPKQKTKRKKADKKPKSNPEKRGKESSDQKEYKKSSVKEKQTSTNSIDEIIEDSHTENTTNNNNNLTNNNNNYLSTNTSKQDKLLDSMCEWAEEAAAKESENGYTLDDLQQFLLKSSIKELFPFPLELKTTLQTFQRLNDVIYKLETVRLDQLLDLYHLAIIMQRFQPLEAAMSERHELLDAVGELSLELQPKDIEYIGISLCDRFVIGCGMQRMEHLINMFQAIVMLINNSLQNSQIAMLTLLATFAKVSGLTMPDQHLDTDIIKNAFEMAKLVNWKQLVESNRLPDMFVLVRCFGLIINSQRNRRIYPNWYKEMGHDIHNFFMIVLRSVRLCRNYNFFAMTIERYIAFCVIRGAAPRPYATDEM